jgi:hypothetical protein
MSKSLFHELLQTFAIGFILLPTALATAQVSAGSSDPTRAAADLQQQLGASSSDQPEVAPLFNSPSLDQPGIKELGGSGNWFSENMKLFSWGPVAVRSAEVLYGFSSANPEAGVAGSLSSAVFQADVAYSKRLPSSTLVLQYSPRLIYGNGEVSLAAANQDAAFNMLFAPAPHMTVGLAESFSFYGAANTFNDKTLGNGNTDAAITNPFLSSLGNSQRQTWLESFSVPLDYNPTETTSVRVAPLVNYVRTSEPGASTGVDQSGPAISMFDYGVQTQMSHGLSPDQTIGMFYNYQMDRQTGLEGTTLFHSFGLSASRRLGQGLTVSGQGGGSYSSGRQSTGWSIVGSVSMTKAFRRGSFEASYGRDSTFTGFIGSNYNNRAWASYSQHAGRRMNWNVAGGYLSGASLGVKASGKYASSRVDYSLTPTLAWSFSYVHFWEAGGAQLVNGGQSQLQMGLRWTPRLRSGI